MKVGIIGAGRVSKNHVGPVTEIDGLELAAVCDLQSDRGLPIAETNGVPFYENYHDMLTREEIDLVSIITPSGMHPKHVIDVIDRYGKHIVIEKPMALKLSDVKAMQEAADAAGVKIFPVYQNRYNPAVQKVKRDIETGALGKVALGTVRVRWCRPQPYYDRDPWRGTWAMDGGALTNQGIHYIDLLQYLVGDVAEVNGQMATQLVNVEVEDTYVGSLKFANGALGNIEVTTAARPDDFEASVSILCEKGTVILGGLACNQIDLHTLDPSACEEHSQDIPDAYGFGHWPFFEAVVKDLEGGEKHPVSMDEGCKAIRLLNALYLSAEENRSVALDDSCESLRFGEPSPELEALYTSQPL